LDLWDFIPFFSSEVGYLGLALVSFFGSLIPFVPIPSFILLVTMSVGNQFDLHILAIIAAVTATVAKQIIFAISYGGRKIMSEKTKQRMLPFQRLVKKYGAAAAFVAAATPIPDDIIYVPLGLAKYNPLRFFIATLTGKLVLCYAIVILAHYLSGPVVDPIFEMFGITEPEDLDDPTPIIIGIVVFGAAMTAVVVLMLRMDWSRILGRFLPWTLEDDDQDQK
jgi:membrane protein YqaA with SNARE-associated domain|tara:strand:+ start:639 stop:1304 length:666 start_codon:yes stop_codon:yes gene_type:complete